MFCGFFYYFLSLKKDLNVPSKSNTQKTRISYLAENITDAPAGGREHCRQLLLWRLEERLPVLVQRVGGQAGEAAPGDGRPLLARHTPPATLQRGQLATALPLNQEKYICCNTVLQIWCLFDPRIRDGIQIIFPRKPIFWVKILKLYPGSIAIYSTGQCCESGSTSF